jgi:hypothetical protein
MGQGSCSRGRRATSGSRLSTDGPFQINYHGIFNADGLRVAIFTLDLSECDLPLPACLVLVRPEMERGRSPLVSIPPLRGGDFQGIKVYRSDEDLEAAKGTGSGAAIQRFDEPTRLSPFMVASPQSPLPFRQARSL